MGFVEESVSSSDFPQVAIIGGGIAGLTLALGLLRRGITATVYERSDSLRDGGAGIGFSSNAERAMQALDPRIHDAFQRVRVQNGTDWFKWMDGTEIAGRTRSPTDPDPLIHRMYLGERGFEGCHRAQFLEELAKMIPPGTIRFSKHLRDIVDRPGAARVQLRFADGATADADLGMFGQAPDDYGTDCIASGRLRWDPVTRETAGTR